MQLFQSHADCRAALLAFATGPCSALPSAMQPRFTDAAAAVSIVDALKAAAELAFANFAGISDATAKTAAMTLGAQCAAWWTAPLNSFAGADRATGLFNALARELGETAPPGGWPDPSADPERDPNWIVAA